MRLLPPDQRQSPASRRPRVPPRPAPIRLHQSARARVVEIRERRAYYAWYVQTQKISLLFAVRLWRISDGFDCRVSQQHLRVLSRR
jgi:hypothetical protein